MSVFAVQMHFTETGLSTGNLECDICVIFEVRMVKLRLIADVRWGYIFTYVYIKKPFFLSVALHVLPLAGNDNHYAFVAFGK